MEKKDNRGGARLGAGRKGEGKVLITGTVKKELADLLAKEPNKSAVIEIALAEYYARIK